MLYTSDSQLNYCKRVGTDAEVPAHRTVVSTITVANLTLPPTGQHIHTGAAGVPGGVLIALPGTWSGSTTASATDISNIIANPAGFYVNVHTTDYPGGAIRGQMVASTTASIPTLSPLWLSGLIGTLLVAGFLALKRA